MLLVNMKETAMAKLKKIPVQVEKDPAPNIMNLT
jgi:hypothetical protein